MNRPLRFSRAGPRMTMNIAGKMKRTSGKSILIGAFIAFSSAAACRFNRVSAAWTRRMRPSEIPSWSAWMIARVKVETSGVSSRSAILFSASWRLSPIRISPSARLNSSVSAPSMCSASFEIAPSKPRPASTLTASRSRASGSSDRIASRRARAFAVRTKSGMTKPTNAPPTVRKRPIAGPEGRPTSAPKTSPPIASAPLAARKAYSATKKAAPASSANPRKRSIRLPLEGDDLLEHERADQHHHEGEHDQLVTGRGVVERAHVARVDDGQHPSHEEGQAAQDVGRHAAHRGQRLDLARELLTVPDRLGDHVEEAREAAADLPLDGHGGDDEIEGLSAPAN